MQMDFTRSFQRLSPIRNSPVALSFQIVLVWLIIMYITSAFYKRFRRVKAPRIGKNPWLSGLARARADFFQNGKYLTKKGYAVYKDSMYWIQTGDMERLVLSNRYLDELRRLPDSLVDSKGAVVDRNLGWYNRVDIILKSTAHVDVCRTQLVQNLDKVTEGQARDLESIFQRELPACFQNQESKFYNAAETILNIVNRSSAKSLVGEPLCHDETWLRNSLETTVNTGMLCRDLQRYPSLLRPLVYPFTKSRKKLNDSFVIAQEQLSGVINGRKQGEGNVDILQWLMDKYKGDEFNLPFLTNQILFIAIAATRSTATSIVNTLYDLVAYPQYQELLLREIEDALRVSGTWDLDAIKRMDRLDSFIKESQRLSPHLLLSFNRKIRRNVTLSDGICIPPGTFISTSAYWTARDPEIFDGGEAFKPWRWFEQREAAKSAGESTSAYLATSTSMDNLHWGYGRNACPGRFMAVAQIKLIIAWILWHFEVCFPEGQSERPATMFLDERVVPDQKQKIGFRLVRRERPNFKTVTT